MDLLLFIIEEIFFLVVIYLVKLFVESQILFTYFLIW